MKKLTAPLLAGIAGLFLLVMTTPAIAAEEETISGEAKCAKCALHETDKCQTVIQTEKDGKKVTYYLTNNKVAKDFHKTVCEEAKHVTATGKVTEKDGKMMLAAKTIEAK